ncbi:MAG: class I SAM-dependent methyltransferase [Haloarculaceae archaeon]
MTGLLAALQGDPWGALRLVLGDPLHPGGHEATAALLDRAGVDEGTRVLDVGCGAGGALDLARERGADAVGLDRDPAADPDDGVGVVRGDLSTLPVRDGAVDAVLGECVLCLAPDLDRSLAETRRVVGPGGRLAFSDVTVSGEPPDLPPFLAEALCLTDRRDRAGLVAAVERAGYEVRDVRSHREDLVAMREEAAGKLDVDALLAALGDRGERLREGVADLDAAIDRGDVGYVSLVGEAV